MTIDDKIRDEKLQSGFNIEAEIASLSSDNIDQYEYLTGKEVLPTDQGKVIEQTYFQVYFFSIRESFGKTNKQN